MKLYSSLVFLLCAFVLAGCGDSSAGPDEAELSFIDISVTEYSGLFEPVLSPDGSFVAFCTNDGMSVVETRNGALRFSSWLVRIPYLAVLRFSSDNSKFVGSYYAPISSSTHPAVSRAVVGSVHSGELLQDFDSTVSAVFMPDGRSILAINLPSYDIVQYDIETGAEVKRYTGLKKLHRDAQLVGVRSDGSVLYKEHHRGSTLIGCWDLATDSPVSELAFDESLRASASPDGMRWYVHLDITGEVQYDSIRSYDAATCQLIHSIKIPCRRSYVSPDGSFLAFQSDDHTADIKIGLSDMKTGALIRYLSNEDLGSCVPCGFSADGSRLVGCADSMIRIWQLPKIP